MKVDFKISNNSISVISNAFRNMADPRAAQATKAAFNQSAKLLERSWKDWARGGSIPGAEDIKNPNTRLAQSIKSVDIGPFDTVVGTDSPYMERIQSGVKAYDMKDTYPFGRKSRRTKDGRGYLIIPFRWGTPNKNGGARAHFRNVIPQELYKVVQKYKASVVSGETHLEENYARQLVERQEYFWGDRLKDEDSGNANGMVRMEDRATGGSTYFTFRVISEKNSMNGDKWWKKAVPPNDVTGALIRSNEKTIVDLIERGLRSDLGLDS